MVLWLRLISKEGSPISTYSLKYSHDLIRFCSESIRATSSRHFLKKGLFPM